MAQEQPSQNQKQLQVKATDEVLKGVYANMVQVGHTSEEFVLDFMNLMPNMGTLNARVIVSPSHAKRLANALMDNIKKYEEQHGTISLAVVPDQKIGFRTE
ncbi:MAG: DUF3467 domain-containing protein [Candidatus Doudnabacteria bacterium CG10_big_fil_rev_8_21_14_0_10_42_18]|uniref:DUF3467 domain-containing protein n=1 Tax=Candidatus Doudnabacteria bacterium CG10_big_fil_rev_8_21_14_0_10_42_18 TaxID=1974552 RepID=A0A2H0VC46_9BACT|nr:MAG: DUF3467 domain-containing protein [Candidatus Doudnabacteria bacterium CG10_big_fil_rev_8_21_14_0_10_42_18]